jgi:GMP synthase-like glutamine amidotransferase
VAGRLAERLGATVTDQLPDPAGLRFAVLVGAEVSSADVTRPWSPDRGEWLRAADEAGTPVLAIGSAAELLAVALGGGVEPASRGQHGFTLLETAAPRLIAPGPWLAFSANAIELPPRARPLAHDRTGTKAFRVGRHLGVHFHPHATPALAAEWLATSRDGIDLSELRSAAAGGTWPAPAAAAKRLFDGFLDSIG